MAAEAACDTVFGVHLCCGLQRSRRHEWWQSGSNALSIVEGEYFCAQGFCVSRMSNGDSVWRSDGKLNGFHWNKRRRRRRHRRRRGRGECDQRLCSVWSRGGCNKSDQNWFWCAGRLRFYLHLSRRTYGCLWRLDWNDQLLIDQNSCGVVDAVHAQHISYFDFESCCNR